MRGTDPAALFVRVEFVMIRMTSTEIPLTPIERPRCANCQTRMLLMRSSPLPNGAEKRIFECPKCSFSETRTVDDPLRSEAVERLTEHVRPPR
jgi:hypothetical protein